MAKKFIGPYQTGLQLNLEPWLINEEAFTELYNAYVWRGRIRKKQGIVFLDRLGMLVEPLPEVKANWAVGVAVYNCVTTNANVKPGSVIVTVTVGVALWPALMTFNDNGNGTLTCIDAPIDAAGYLWGRGTIDYLNGTIDLEINNNLPAGGVVNITAYYTLSRLPVMGIGTREQDEINQEQTIAFDVRKAYEFNSATQIFNNVSYYKMTAPKNPVLWRGADYNFFWTTNYYRVDNRKIFWATNNFPGDHARALTLIQAGGAPTDIQITLGAGHPFIVNDVVYLDQITVDNSYNGLTGVVTVITGTTIDVTVTPGLFGASTGYVFALTRDDVYIGDGIKYYDGSTGNLGWRNFQPPLQLYSATTLHPNYLSGCLCLIPYKDRLLAFNTWEGQARGLKTNYFNRVRYSQNGTPFYATTNTPTAAGQPRAGSSWMDNIIGKGGYIDAPTSQAIVSVSEHRDGIIVFFERSTWLLRYNYSELVPFIWVKINEEQGCESTFSKIFFDNEVLAVGEKGLVKANSNSVARIDQKIPDWVFDIHNQDRGIDRVHGIRDFNNKLCYWTYPIQRQDTGTIQNTLYPTRVLSYNYESDSFGIYNNFFTCFGELRNDQSIMWGSDTVYWKDDIKWGSGRLQAEYPHIIAGNQMGFIHYFDLNGITNEESMDLDNASGINTITAANYPVIQVANHCLSEGQFIRIKDTTAFPLLIAGEAIIPYLVPEPLPPSWPFAPAGSTAFMGKIANLGLFPSTLVIHIGGVWQFIDLGNGVLIDTTGVYYGYIDYLSGIFTVNFAALALDTQVTADYTHNWINNRIFKIAAVSDSFFSIIDLTHDYTVFANYTGTGTIEVVDNFSIKTKSLNPFLQDDIEVRLNYLNLYLTTSEMTFTMNVYGDDNYVTVLDSEIVSTTDYYNQEGSKTWNRTYPDTISAFLQLEFTLSDSQIVSYDNISNFFELHAMLLDINPGGRLK